MNFSCVFLLALALFGAVTQAYLPTGNFGYGGVGAFGCNGLCETACGGPLGAGYGPGYGTGFGCGYGARYEGTGCGCRNGCGSAAVCDCQCMKTIVRPPLIERFPVPCAKRVRSSCRCSCGCYSGAGVAGAGIGGAGYMNGGFY